MLLEHPLNYLCDLMPGLTIAPKPWRRTMWRRKPWPMSRRCREPPRATSMPSCQSSRCAYAPSSPCCPSPASSHWPPPKPADKQDRGRCIRLSGYLALRCALGGRTFFWAALSGAGTCSHLHFVESRHSVTSGCSGCSVAQWCTVVKQRSSQTPDCSRVHGCRAVSASVLLDSLEMAMS